MTETIFVLGAGLVSVPFNPAIRALLVRVRPAEPALSMGAGRWIGVLERLIIYVLVVADETAAAALVVTAKSILRFPEITGDEPHLDAEYVLIGSLASWLVAIAVGLGTRRLIALL